MAWPGGIGTHSRPTESNIIFCILMDKYILTYEYEYKTMLSASRGKYPGPNGDLTGSQTPQLGVCPSPQWQNPG